MRKYPEDDWERFCALNAHTENREEVLIALALLGASLLVVLLLTLLLMS